jgi:exosome complex RNA-binding protein Rrp42 (RNase PH superfamily)
MGRKSISSISSYRTCEVTFVEQSRFESSGKKGTKVICHVVCEIGKPSIDRPNEGGINVHVVFSPMASMVFDSYRLPETCIQTSRTLEKVLRDLCVIETESLCIIAGHKVGA